MIPFGGLGGCHEAIKVDSARVAFVLTVTDLTIVGTEKEKKIRGTKQDTDGSHFFHHSDFHALRRFSVSGCTLALEDECSKGIGNTAKLRYFVPSGERKNGTY